MASSSGTCQRQFSRFRKDIWDAYNDAGLVVVVCLKLEAILSELLAQFCQAKSPDLAHHYHSEYPNKQNKKNTTIDFANRNFSLIIQNHCKFTFGNLIKEVFEPGEEILTEWGSPACHFSLNDNEKSLLSQINDLRNAIVHYGENTNVNTVLGHLTEEQRKQIILHYKFIVNQSKIFEKAYPDTTAKVSSFAKNVKPTATPLVFCEQAYYPLLPICGALMMTSSPLPLRESDNIMLHFD